MSPLVLLALALAFGPAAVAKPTGEPSAPSIHPHVAGEALVQLTPPAAAEARRVLEAKGTPRMLAELGVSGLKRALEPLPPRQRHLDRRFGFDRLFVASLDPSSDVAAVCRRLAEDPRVEFAHPNYLGEGGAEQALANDTYLTSQWNIHNTGQFSGVPDADIDAVEGWTIAVGRRETLVAVLDTGIDSNHPAFIGRIAAGGHDFVAEDMDPEADHRHSVQVAGILAANANNRFGIAGINWRTQILPVKILDSSNLGTTLNLIEGLRHIAATGPHVANLSLIRYPNTTSLHNAVKAADEAGVVLIGCNGNDGISSPNYPASYPEVLSAGWTTREDLRSSSSNWTTTLDVVAPGVSVPTPVYDSRQDLFTSFSGCSAATPHVAAVAALLLTLDPTLTYAQIRDVLIATAEDQVGDPTEDLPGRDDYYGWGRINMEGALRSLGYVSRDEIHVDDITLRRIDGTTLEIDVIVLDDLTGVERDVLVEGQLTLPDATAVPLSGTTASNGTATMSWEPGGELAAGTFSFEVLELSATGRTWVPEADRESVETHDPDLAALHVDDVRLLAAPGELYAEVRVLDDDDLPADPVLITARVTPPVGEAMLAQATTLGSQGGVARFAFEPPLEPGPYHFEVVALQKAGFTRDSARDVVTEAEHELLALDADPDLDGVLHLVDNCPLTANGDQSDVDADGIGDACDVCPSRNDPAQWDRDEDGRGDRCDCAPYDASRIGLAAVSGIALGDDKMTVKWDGVSGADAYDVSRGLLSQLQADALGSCLAENLAGISVEDRDRPPSGDGFFYLVRGDDATCGAGSYGSGLAGAERSNLDPAACR